MLTAETRTRDAAEPSGEPDSLWGRMKGKMGDRVHHNQPEELVDRKAKAKKKCAPAVTRILISAVLTRTQVPFLPREGWSKAGTTMFDSR